MTCSDSILDPDGDVEHRNLASLCMPMTLLKAATRCGTLAHPVAVCARYH